MITGDLFNSTEDALDLDKIPDLLTASRQSVFDFAVGNMFRQGVRSGVKGYGQYRDGGLKCAVGFFIPDDSYTSRMEGYGVTSVFDMIDVEVPIETTRILEELQEIHDNLDEDLWADALKKMASTFGLRWRF